MDKGSKEIVYKNLGRKDLPILETLWKQLNRHHLKKNRVFKERYRNFRFEDRISSLLEKIRGDLLMVVTAWDRSGGQPIGYCISSVDYLGVGEIDSIFIQKEYRKKGVGEELMKRSLEWLGRQKPKSLKIVVAAGNEEVFGFYKKFGFFPGKTILERK